MLGDLKDVVGIPLSSLLALGGMLMVLLGLTRVETKWGKVGFDNFVVRFVLGLVGLGLLMVVVFALPPQSSGSGLKFKFPVTPAANAGENLRIGSTASIQWPLKCDGGFVEVVLIQETGRRILKDKCANTGEFRWVVEGPTDKHSTFEIRCLEGDMVGASPFSFKITN